MNRSLVATLAISVFLQSPIGFAADPREREPGYRGNAPGQGQRPPSQQPSRPEPQRPPDRDRGSQRPAPQRPPEYRPPAPAPRPPAQRPPTQRPPEYRPPQRRPAPYPPRQQPIPRPPPQRPPSQSYPYPPPSYPYPQPPPSYPYPDNPSYGYGEAALSFYSVSRRSGGEWLRLNILNAVSIRHLQVHCDRAGVQLHEAYAITEYGERYQIRELSRTGVIYAGQTVYSENLNIRDRIVAIDIRAEGMGGDTNLTVIVTSDEATPRLSSAR